MSIQRCQSSIQSFSQSDHRRFYSIWKKNYFFKYDQIRLSSFNLCG